MASREELSVVKAPAPLSSWVYCRFMMSASGQAFRSHLSRIVIPIQDVNCETQIPYESVNAVVSLCNESLC